MGKLISHSETLFSGTATSSSNSHSAPVITEWSSEGQIFLSITAVSGTNPTLDVTIKTYGSIADEWFLLATFSQKTGITTDFGTVGFGLGEKWAIDYTIGGTNSPSFTFSVTAHLKDPT